MISREEWLRLRTAAAGGQSSPHPVSDRKERHERSKAIVKHWENTIEVSVYIYQLLGISSDGNDPPTGATLEEASGQRAERGKRRSECMLSLITLDIDIMLVV